MKRQFIYLGLGLVIAIAASIALRAYQSSGEFTSAASSTGKAEIGGPFTLVDHNRKTVTDADFKGRYMLIFFGYTFCPDVCPTALQGVSDALDILGKDAEEIAPLFISVDPERDTVEVLKEYVGNFHPKIIGLTGTLEQITSVAIIYRAYFSKAPAEDGGSEDYSMSHSAYLYLMGPDGEFLTVFGHQTAPEETAKQIKKYL